MAKSKKKLTPQKADPALDRIIKLAIMAVGGQGGGVLTGWIEDCARSNGYVTQSTSVAGVAQRTGATIYYVEMAPAGDREPVFSLAPSAGDVDILIAAEMMEAGRAIMRGFVTPDRTTLIASSHRALAVSEKTVPGDGIANSEEVIAAAEIAARRFICFDMDTMAVSNGSVISSSLFGALAGSDALPFTREQFEEAIRKSGRGVEASLRAFGASYEAAQAELRQTPSVQENRAAIKAEGADELLLQWRELSGRVEQLPLQAQDMALNGLRSVVDFQDIDYGREYLDRLDKIRAMDSEDNGFLLTHEAAKYLARAMAYDDIMRVADLKTRAARFERIRREMKQPDGTRLRTTEFMHPRAEELVSILPARFGRKVSGNASMMKWIDRIFNRGRRLRSDRMLPFIQLYALGGLRRWRRGTLRHATEVEHMEKWLSNALSFARTDYDFAVELIRNHRLIKGYSDTHARGLSKFDRVNDGAMLLAGRPDAAEWVARLREAALKDEKGEALDGALKTVNSFAMEKPLA